MEPLILIPLVDNDDQIIGHEEKLKVHQLGLLHRAFSILIYNSEGKMLIHKRALGKYHSPGLWTNTCCGHPNKDESMESATKRRLYEEMGIVCDLNYKFTFSYTASFDNGLIENEIDHVYTGKFDNDFIINQEEVCEYEWLDNEDIKERVSKNPSEFTFWFKEILKYI
jgi:isopentenyl-diphosphate Delta-isomerase